MVGRILYTVSTADIRALAGASSKGELTLDFDIPGRAHRANRLVSIGSPVCAGRHPALGLTGPSAAISFACSLCIERKQKVMKRG